LIKRTPFDKSNTPFQKSVRHKHIISKLPGKQPWLVDIASPPKNQSFSAINLIADLRMLTNVEN